MHLVSTPPEMLRDPKLPYISALPKYGDSDKELHFRILRLHPDVQEYRLLYVAETRDNKQIIVKFTRRYSIELHAKCAKQGHAPNILGFGQFPGGWTVVAMEYIYPSMHPSRSPDLTRHLDKWMDDLQRLVQSFHNDGFVHGDLREPNILCDGEKMLLIDFDWGGEVGKTCYPHARLCSELWDERDGSDPFITKEDDNRVLGNTFDGLKRMVLNALNA
jgi:hypothetical protein